MDILKRSQDLPEILREKCSMPWKLWPEMLNFCCMCSAIWRNMIEKLKKCSGEKIRQGPCPHRAQSLVGETDRKSKS